MTTEERKRAAGVMAAEGPWDMRGRSDPEDAWSPYPGEPAWDWIRYDYRVRPPEPPVPGGCWECRRMGDAEWMVSATQDPRKFRHGWEYRFVDPPAALPKPAPLPCPWCGAIPEPTSAWPVECKVCNAQGPTAVVVMPGSAAVAAWNRRAPCPQCAQLRTELDCLAARNARLAEELALLRRVPPAVTQMASLIAESRGVSGLHLNGDEAPWGELLSGGRYEEWLGALADAEVALAEWRAKYGGPAK